MSILGFAERPAPAAPAPDPFFAMLQDETVAAGIARWAEGRGWSRAAVQLGNCDAALGVLRVAAPPDLLIVDIDGQSEPAAAVRALRDHAGAAMRLVVVGAANDLALYRRLRQAGADDYLAKPLEPDELDRAAAPRPAPPRPAEAAADTRAVAVIGAKGGAGATTLAALLACRFHGRGRSTVAVDFDFAFGSLGLALDIAPGSGLREALAAPDRIDAVFLSRAIAGRPDRVRLLAAEPSFLPAEIADGAGPRLIEALRPMAGGIVADLPRALAWRDPALLAGFDALVLVTDASLAGLRDTARLVRQLGPALPGVAPKLVVNRYAAHDLDRATIADTLGRAPDAIVPFDPAIRRAAEAGEPQRLGRGAAAIVDALAAGLLPAAPPRRRFALLRRA